MDDDDDDDEEEGRRRILLRVLGYLSAGVIVNLFYFAVNEFAVSTAPPPFNSTEARFIVT